MHYLLNGGAKRLDPHPLFDTGFYLLQVSDTGAFNPLTHYVTKGWKESLRPNRSFDPLRYSPGNNPLRHRTFEDFVRFFLLANRASDKGESSREGALTWLLDNYASPTQTELQDQLNLVERMIGRPFCQCASIKGGAVPFDPASQGSVFEEYFVPPEPFLKSLTLYFFTYARQNGATLKVTLSCFVGSEQLTILEQDIKKDDIFDGRGYPIWLRRPIPNSHHRLFRLVISIETLDPERLITIAGSSPTYRAPLRNCSPKP